MRILYKTEIEDATITASSEDGNYPKEDIVDISTLKTWRSTSDEDYIVFELSTGTRFTGVALVYNNFTSSATIKVEANTTDVWTSPAFTKTLTYQDYIIYEEIDTTGVALTDLVFWRIYVDDPTNTDGYIEIGYCMLGQNFDVPGMTPTQKIYRNTNSIAQFSTGNNVFGDPRPNYDRFSVDIPIYDNTERNEFIDMFNNNGNYRPMVVAIWEDDQDFEPFHYCVLAQGEIENSKNKDALFSAPLEWRDVE